jgi:hypothetical protein
MDMSPLSFRFIKPHPAFNYQGISQFLKDAFVSLSLVRTVPRILLNHHSIFDYKLSNSWSFGGHEP